MDYKEVLMEFLSYRLEDSMPILRRFAGLNRAIAHFDGGKDNFVYIPGTRTDRVVLVAHADTIWDRCYSDYTDIDEDTLLNEKHAPVLDRGFVRQDGWDGWGIGADDRAGCAILWLLRETGHSLLITDGEEHHQIGSYHLMYHYPELGQELNEHSYMMQLDRRNSYEYKTYSLPVSEDFIQYVESHTDYSKVSRHSRSDIIALCTQICGVNLSVGYYSEHHPDEVIDVESWLNTLNIVTEMLEGEQPRFPLTSTSNL